MTRNVSIFLIFVHLFIFFGLVSPNQSLIKMKILLAKGKKIAADKGSDDGIQEGMLFLVHREGNIIGMAKVVRLKEKRCALIAETLSKHIEIMPGDMLLLDLKDLEEPEKVKEPELNALPVEAAEIEVPERLAAYSEESIAEEPRNFSQSNETEEQEPLPFHSHENKAEVPENQASDFIEIQAEAAEKPTVIFEEKEPGDPAETSDQIETSKLENHEAFVPYIEESRDSQNLAPSIEEAETGEPVLETPDFGTLDITEAEIELPEEKDVPNVSGIEGAPDTTAAPAILPRKIRLDYFFEGQMTAETDYSGGGAVGFGLATGCFSGFIGWGIGYVVLSGMDAKVPFHRVQNMNQISRIEFSNGYRDKVIKKRKTKFSVGAALGTVAGVLLVLSARN